MLDVRKIGTFTLLVAVAFFISNSLSIAFADEPKLLQGELSNTTISGYDSTAVTLDLPSSPIGISITPVPEPSAFGLLSVGIAGLGVLIGSKHR